MDKFDQIKCVVVYEFVWSGEIRFIPGSFIWFYGFSQFVDL